MVNHQGASLEEQVKVLLEHNLAYSKEIYHLTKKIKNYMLWSRILSLFSLFIFVILPIILGVVYLPSIIRNIINRFIPTSIGQTTNPQDLLGGQNINQEDLIKMIQEQGGPLNFYQKILDLNNQ